LHAEACFWRTYEQQEIDLVEEHSGRLMGYDFKWSVKTAVRAPSLWQKIYPDSEFTLVNPQNFPDFVLIK
jgi:uncharacterized protein